MPGKNEILQKKKRNVRELSENFTFQPDGARMFVQMYSSCQIHKLSGKF